MTQNTTPPFFQLGRRVRCRLCAGSAVEELSGEVMDTDVGWIALKLDNSDEIRWLNLDLIAAITVLGRANHR